ncbi:MAG: PEGA domain-containing protein [Myxococcota bacterium]
MSFRLSAFAGALFALQLLAAQSAAAQQESVYVLGLRSVEGDDEFARELSGAIRVAAGGVPGWAVSPDEVSLSQMTMVYGCDDPNTECMASIAEELSADKVIYGTVRRSGTGDDFSFGLSLYLFDRASGSLTDQLTDTIPPSEAGTDVLQSRAERYAAQLGGVARYGAVRLDVGESGATVQVDGETIGMTNSAGTILVEDLTEGTHAIRIDAAGFDPFETEVDIEADEQKELRVNLSAPGTDVGSGPNLRWVPGAALLAAGGVFFALGVRSGAKVLGFRSDIDAIPGDREALTRCVRSQNDDLQNGDSVITCNLSDGSAFNLNRTQALVLTAPGATADQPAQDACNFSEDVANDDWRRGVCDNHRKQRILQWVFYSLAAATAGVGVALIIRSLGEDDDDAAHGARSTWAARGEGGVDFTLNF